MTFTARLYSNLGTRHGIEPSSWRQDAACRDADPSIFFPEVGEAPDVRFAEAKKFCDRCPVSLECFREAKSFQGTYGVWGGKVFGNKEPKWDGYEHGSEASYKRHRRYGEKPCPECLEAALEAQRKRYKERKAS